MFSLESPHRDDSNESTQYIIFDIKKFLLNYPKSAAMGLSKGPRNEFETGLVNEPSVFEPLKVYCMDGWMICEFTSFLTIFQSNQGDVRMIMNGCMQWLVGCFGLNGPLRQYFSLYRAVSQREGERGQEG